MALAVACDVCGNVITNTDVNQDIYACTIRHYKVRSLVSVGYGSFNKEQTIHICPKCYNKLLVLTKYKLAV